MNENETDPLNLNVELANHDASRPLLPDGQHEGIIANVQVVMSKNADTPTFRNLMVTVKTTMEIMSTKGGMLAAGYELKRWLPLQASQKQIDAGNANSWKDQLSNMVDGIFGCSPADRPALNSETITEMIGKAITFSSKVRHDEQYGDSNDLGRMIASE